MSYSTSVRSAAGSPRPGMRGAPARTALCMLALSTAVMLLASPVAAQLYSYVDDTGVRVITDQKPTGHSFTALDTPTERARSTGTTTAAAHSWKIYEYRDSSGKRLFTNQQSTDSAMQLIATHGRPPAVVQCRHLAQDIMRAGGSDYDDAIAAAATTEGLDPVLVKSVIWIESCFDSRAVSRVGAGGLMQLMPGTASDLGVTDRFDPTQNVRGGTRYLREMLDRFDGDLTLALAAYNAGPGAVERYRNTVPPFAETQNYVRKVRAHYDRFRDSGAAVQTTPRAPPSASASAPLPR